jgi:ankyrin repeat protein
VTARPESLLENDAHKQLPLHVAFRRRFPSLAVVRRLVEAHPKALEMGDCFGMLPLHLAVRNSATTEHRQRNIPLAPETVRATTRQGRLPIHLAGSRGKLDLIRFLGRMWPESVRETTIHGYLPLHDAEGTSQTGVAEFLIDQWPQSVRETTDHGDLVRCTRQRTMAIASRPELLWSAGRNR